MVRIFMVYDTYILTNYGAGEHIICALIIISTFACV